MARTGSTKKMTAGLKHFDAYSVETNRMAFNGNISTFDLWDTEARTLAAMCSYASINGVSSCANAMLLNDVHARDPVDAVAKTLNGGADMELGETCFRTSGYLEQAVKHNHTTVDTVHNNTASMSARPVGPTLTSSNGRCISECPDGGHELGQRVCRMPLHACSNRALPICPLDWLLRQGPPLRVMHHVWHGHLGLHAPRPLTPSALPLDRVQARPRRSSSVSGNAYQPLPDRASCFPTSVCEEPFIETIPPTLTMDRLCSCDTRTCNNLITQLFEEIVCAEPTDEQLDVVLDVCCSGQGEDGIRDTICQMDAYEARRCCPGCTDTCECSAGFILVYDADPADCRPCDSVTEFSPSIGGSKCERGQAEVSAPTYCSSDRVCRDCRAGPIDSDSDGSTGCQMCPRWPLHGGGLPRLLFQLHLPRQHPRPPRQRPCHPVQRRHRVRGGFEEVQGVTHLISDRVCYEYLEGTYKAVSGQPGRALSPRHHVRRRRGRGGFEEVQGVTHLISDRVCYEYLEGTQCEVGAAFKPVDGQAESCRPVTRCDEDKEEIREPTRQHDRLCHKCVQDTCVGVSRCAAWGYISTHGRQQELLHPIALMLNGTLDCLSNLHFIHIRQLFRVLTTLTFDRQRTAARRPH
ncbi:hypothetical protein PTSG_12595 [Salpingoeca rosetta]|uniref:TNFR-Cys domain-containing protein n=1 Tax=Salpingoeca rosetta (strain ATCC 50818 / BSB-021) TaxID=946362 RepID=F2UGY4_SALR5|nr:uncharacterized protein PTSG_12595 [Salpingoeca rosetta]EGD76383.1 hypothetical protein PTSG_12595 [Salpingoeca rosetta]|eukprot:XP_004991298.1 hypothetical protein PTSG_12595 [Salpingoeca rosetta]